MEYMFRKNETVEHTCVCISRIFSDTETYAHTNLQNEHILFFEYVAKSEIDCVRCSCLLCKVVRHMMRSCCKACQNLKHFTSIWPLNLFHFVFRFESFLRYYFRRENRLFSKISQLAKFTSDIFSFTLSFMQLPYVRNIKTATRKEEVDIDDAFKLWCVFLFFYFDVISLLVEVQGQYFIVVISLYFT